MLFILALVVSQLAVEFVQGVLEFLNVLVGIGNLVVNNVQVVVLLSHNILHSVKTIVIVLQIRLKKIALLSEVVNVSIQLVGAVSESAQFTIVGMIHLLLVMNKGLYVLNLFPEVKIGRIDSAHFVSQAGKFTVGLVDILFNSENLLKHITLLFFNNLILGFEAIELSDQGIDLLAVL